MDLQKGFPNESFDFEDISQNGKQTKSKVDRRGKAINTNGNGNGNRDTSKQEETQNLAESSSFVASRNTFDGYHYNEPNESKFTLASERKPQQTTVASVITSVAASTVITTTTTERPTTINPNTNIRTTSVVTTTARNADVKQQDRFNGYFYQEPDRSSRKLEHTRLPYNHITEAATTSAPTAYPPRRGSATYKDSQTPTPFIIKVPETTANSVTTEQKVITTTYPTTRRRPITTTTEPFETTFRDTTTRSRTRLTTVSTHPPLIRNTGSTSTTNARLETSRTTPFYTPTVPTVLPSRTTVSNRVSIKNSTPKSTAPTAPSPVSVAEHAMEMMKTLQDLKLDGPTPSTDAEKETGGRPGLIIPPSSGPETLHSLALYFATAVDNLTNQSLEATTNKAEIPGLENLDVEIGNVTKLESTLISDSTARRYEHLFGTKDIYNDTRKGKVNNRISENLELPSFNYGDGQSSMNENDLEAELSRNPIMAAAGSPHLRELAQVFTHALSAYLHDPITFRRVLSEIRPTEPSTTKSFEFTNRGGRTDDFNNGTGPTYLPTVPTQTATGTTPMTPTTDDLEVLDFSDVTQSTVRKETTTVDSSDTSTMPTTFKSDITTTNAPPTTYQLAATTTSLLKESLKSIDHVPASRILTEPLENYAVNQYTSNSLIETTTDTSNPLAMEINGGLEAQTTFPYLEEENESESAQNISSYQPTKTSNDKKKNQSPYGKGVKPSNSTPIHDQSPTVPTTVNSSALSFELLPPTTVNKAFNLPTHDILPPLDDNDLHSAHSQSIFGDNNNKLEQTRTGKEFKGRGKQTKTHENITEQPRNGHYITQVPTTSTQPPEKIQRTTIPDVGRYNSDSRSTLAYSVFLDPLTINDGLMGGSHEQTTITPSPHTYLPQSTLIPPFFEYNRATTETSRNKLASRLSLKELAAGKSYDSRKSKTIVTTTLAPIEEDYMKVMQRKANEMFGQLNDTSAGHLMNVMKKADKSKMVRRLILLLIQTCDDDFNSTVESTRTALLNALIGLDGKIDDENELQVINANINSNRNSKSLNLAKSLNLIAPAAPAVTTSTQIPITTYHRPIKNVLALRSSATSVPPQYLSESTSTFSSLNLDSSTTTRDFFKSTGYTTEYSETDSPSTYFPTDTNQPTTITTQGLRTSPTTTTPQTPTTTVVSTTTTTTTTSTTTRKPKTRQRQRQTQQQSQNRNSRRIVKDLDQFLAHQGDSTLTVDAAHKSSDARALDLLKSLYSLAGRFGK